MRGALAGFRLEGFGGGGTGATPGRETCEAFCEGGPRKRDGGGSRSCLAFVFGEEDIITWLSLFLSSKCDGLQAWFQALSAKRSSDIM
jgi:hypothetical protein